MKPIRHFIKKTGIACAALVMAAGIIFPAVAQAATYKDVPATGYYATAAIDWVSNNGIMLGDASNNFYPNRTVDRFEAAKILAIASGYKYSSTTPAELEIFNRAYETYKPLLDSLKTQYPNRWSTTADREIAFLLYRNVFTTTDVAMFVSKTNGVESVTSLTKQEVVMYMVRLDGKQAEADAIVIPYRAPFTDDTAIRADYKKYIYYAKEIGLVEGSEGRVEPARTILRAELAALLYRIRVTLNRPQLPLVPITPTPTPPPTTPNVNTTVTGVIESVYLDTHVNIVTANTPKWYLLAANAVIQVDNVQRTAAFLVKGMTVNALVNPSYEIVSLVARTAAPVTELPTIVNPSSLTEDEGYVTTVSTTAANQTVTIKTQRIRPTGEIVTNEKAYTLASGCTIKRGAKTVTFTDIKVDDIILFKYMGNSLYEIVLQEKDRTIYGTLVERKFTALAGVPALVVEDDKGTRYELRVTNSTYFMRGNSRNLTWADIRVGDSVEARCEYDRLLEVYATGSRSTVSGTLEEIHITANVQQIVLRKTDRTTATYTITPGDIDVYGLRIGMGLRLYLDSWEIYDVLITSAPSSATTTIVGYIQALRSGNTIVVVENDAAINSYTIRIDDSTIDTRTDRKLDFNTLKVNMYVYIVLSNTQSNLARSVTILPD